MEASESICNATNTQNTQLYYGVRSNSCCDYGYDYQGYVKVALPEGEAMGIIHRGPHGKSFHISTEICHSRGHQKIAINCLYLKTFIVMVCVKSAINCLVRANMGLGQDRCIWYNVWVDSQWCSTILQGNNGVVITLIYGDTWIFDKMTPLQL